jgi:hypothetical protein
MLVVRGFRWVGWRSCMRSACSAAKEGIVAGMAQCWQEGTWGEDGWTWREEGCCCWRRWAFGRARSVVDGRFDGSKIRPLTPAQAGHRHQKVPRDRAPKGRYPCVARALFRIIADPASSFYRTRHIAPPAFAFHPYRPSNPPVRRFCTGFAQQSPGSRRLLSSTTRPPPRPSPSRPSNRPRPSSRSDARDSCTPSFSSTLRRPRS